MKLTILLSLVTLVLPAFSAPLEVRRQSGIPDAATITDLAPDLGFTAGLNPTGSGDCDGAVNGTDGKPVKIPCACPPAPNVYIPALIENVQAGFAVNNPSVKVSFPTGDSKQDKSARITAASITIQNLNGPGKGCPFASTKLGALQKAINDGTDVATPADPPANNIPADDAPSHDTPANNTIPVNPPANNTTPADLPANSTIPANPPANSTIPENPPANSTTPADPPVKTTSANLPVNNTPANDSPSNDTPANNTTPADLPANSTISANPPANSTIPASPPANSTTPADPPVKTTLPVNNAPANDTLSNGTPANNTTPADLPANSTIPADPPVNSTTPVNPPANNTTTGNTPANNTTPGTDIPVGGTRDAATITRLAPELGFKSGINPTGSGDCDGAIDGADGEPIKIPCACPPAEDVYISQLIANVQAGKALNNPAVSVSFPTGDSKGNKSARLTAASITLQNLNGPGKGCPVVSTTFPLQQKEIDGETDVSSSSDLPVKSQPTPAPVPSKPANVSENNSGGLDAATIRSLAPELGFESGLNPTGSGDCDGAVNGTDGRPIKIPCACPPPQDVYLDALVEDVQAGFAVNNPSVKVEYPTGDSKQSESGRITAALIALQNLNGPGKGCPAASTTLLARQRAL